MGAAPQIPLYLDLREAGETLEEVAVDVIKTEKQDVISYWYHSNLDVDVYIWCDERGNVIKQQVSLCGQITEWNIVEGVRTGYVIETEVSGKEDEEESSVRYDLEPQKTSLLQAIDVIKSAAAIEEQYRRMLVVNFQTSPRIDNLDPTEFVTRYSSPGEKPKNNHFLANWFKKLFK